MLRSGNAGCYHCSGTIASVPAISAAAGVHIIRWTFCEPQAGKGPCDRMSANLKRKVRMFVDENNSATNAHEFAVAASSYNGVKGVSIYVGYTRDPDDVSKLKPTIPGISAHVDSIVTYDGHCGL